jgi:hypothetical protein
LSVTLDFPIRMRINRLQVKAPCRFRYEKFACVRTCNM